MLKYPTFSSREFDCMAPNLAIVDFWITLEELEQALRDAERQRDELIRQRRTSYSAAADRLEQLASRAAAEWFANPVDDRSELLRSLLDKSKRCLLSGGLELKLQEDDIAKALRILYGRFNRPEFANDLEKLLDSIGETVPDENDIASGHGRIGSVTAKLNQHWQTVLQVFKDETAPLTWKEQRLSREEAADPVKARRVAEDFVRSFIKTWRERCVLFPEPVTHSGVLIASMPQSRRQVWDLAYKKLGFDALPMRSYFQPLTSNEAPEPEAEKPQSQSKSILGALFGG